MGAVCLVVFLFWWENQPLSLCLVICWVCPILRVGWVTSCSVWVVWSVHFRFVMWLGQLSLYFFDLCEVIWLFIEVLWLVRDVLLVCLQSQTQIEARPPLL